MTVGQMAISTNGKARNARINKATKLAHNINHSLMSLQGHDSVVKIDGDLNIVWAEIRVMLSELNQAFHEASAYNNTVEK